MPHPPRLPRFPVRPLLALACVLSGLWWPLASQAAAGRPTLAIGTGLQRTASWPGANSQHSEPLPYLDIEWPDHGSFSTINGLQINLIHGQVLQGGIYGDYQWGRQRSDLGALAGKLGSLSPRADAGGYLEWQITRQVDVGGDLSHDINGAGAYLNLYAEWDLPPVGVLEHSMQLHWQVMNGPAMRRFFGLTPTEARALNVHAWQPGTGSQLASLEYDLFLPTSQHTGVALVLVYGRLLGDAAASPLVSHYGSRTQLSESLAFVYHL